MERRAFVLPIAAALAFAAFWWPQRDAPRPASAPAASWCLGPGPEYTLARPGDALAPGSPFRLRVQCDEACHVYVFRCTDEAAPERLHPAAEAPAPAPQPLPAGAHWLPGRAGERDLRWSTPSTAATFVVVAARAPVADFQALLARAAGGAAAAPMVNGPLAPDALLPGVWTGAWRVRTLADSGR